MSRVARSEEEFEQQCKNSGGDIRDEFFGSFYGFRCEIGRMPTESYSSLFNDYKVTITEESLSINDDVYKTTYKRHENFRMKERIYEHRLTCKRN